MRSQTVAVSVLGAVGIVVAGNYAAMDVVRCYPTTRNSDAPTTGGSLKPTSGRGTSTQATTGTDIPDASTALIVPESSQTSILSSIGSGSSAITFETTISTLTDELTISLDPTTSTDIIPTSTSGIDEPAGRIVIFQIVVPDNEKRDLNQRATNSFVDNDNPDVCTFATTFNLADGQLFDSGVPIFYSGEDFKELSGQGSPTADAITTTFTDSGQRLVFRNSGLPNGEASFCQKSNDLIYIVFTTGPSSCVPVNLAVYNVEQCQNGRLVGVDELTSTTGITNSETASPEATSSATSTEGVVNSQSTGTKETESVESSSDTASPETITTVSSGAVDSSTSLSSIVTTQAVPETSATDVSALPDTGDDTSTDGGPLTSITTTGPAAETSATSSDTPDDTTTAGESVSSSITTEPVSETSTTKVSTSSSSSIESTESASFTSTSNEPENSTTESSSPQTSDTTSEVVADTTTSAITETTQAGTMANAPAPDETSSTEITGIEDTNTANADIPTTTEGDVVRESTTVALETTTTAVTNPCTLVDNPYPAASGSQFFIYCDSDFDVSSTLESVSNISLQACIDNCSLNSNRKAVKHFKSSSLCLLLSLAGGPIPDEQINIAILDQGE